MLSRSKEAGCADKRDCKKLKALKIKLKCFLQQSYREKPDL